jgi:hypothetical protein
MKPRNVVSPTFPHASRGLMRLSGTSGYLTSKHTKNNSTSCVKKLRWPRLKKRDARIQELEIEAAVNFGEVILLNAPRLWVDHPSTKNKFYSRHCFLSAYNLKKVLIEPPKLA